MQPQRIDYKGFIEKYFKITTKNGEIIDFILNDDQNRYLDMLYDCYPTMQGVRENDLKSRQVGWSSLIDGIGVTDFIMAELGKTPLFDGDIVSHKDKETKVLFNRANLFLDSYLKKKEIPRSTFLKEDTKEHITGMRGSQFWVQTASAKVSGRGGTKQFLHWSEVAFYSNTDIINAEDLVTGAERQVGDGIGKIFRESTGNISDDFFQREYKMGKLGLSDFKSRFFPWYLHLDYTLQSPDDWEVPEYYAKVLSKKVSVHQCYWHFKKTRGLTDEKMMREYPTYDTEAFLLGGRPYFSREALTFYENNIMQPLKEVLYVQNI
jgi:hypothetical protein